MFMHDVSQVVEANGSKPTTYNLSEHSCGKVIWLFINRNLTLDLGQSAISTAQAATFIGQGRSLDAAEVL